MEQKNLKRQNHSHKSKNNHKATIIVMNITILNKIFVSQTVLLILPINRSSWLLSKLDSFQRTFDKKINQETV